MIGISFDFSFGKCSFVFFFLVHVLHVFACSFCSLHLDWFVCSKVFGEVSRFSHVQHDICKHGRSSPSPFQAAKSELPQMILEASSLSHHFVVSPPQDILYIIPYGGGRSAVCKSPQGALALFWSTCLRSIKCHRSGWFQISWHEQLMT